MTKNMLLTLSAMLWLSTFPVMAQPASSNPSKRVGRSGDASDLIGIWRQEVGTHPETIPIKLLIAALGKEVVGINLEQVPSLAPGTPFLKGTYPSPDSRVDIQGFTDRGLVKWYSGTLKFNDPDHFQIAGKIEFTRISRGTPGNVPCDLRNPSRISGAEALARGWLYTHLKDDATAACWFHVGADQGFAEAQMWYATDLIFGTGVAKNLAQAVPWLQKSAMQGSYGAARDLAQIFNTGEGLPKSEQRSKYWQVRAELNDGGFVHTKDFLPIPRWATEKSGACEPSNPSHSNAAAAFMAGRVAYEARALGIAACWFQISAAQGNMRANVYLGILYIFGLGVERNQSAGFKYMETAAKTNDAFALMYLANFYRYGIGTKPDQNQGSLLAQKALRAPDGLDAFMHVQGTLLSAGEVASAVTRGLSAASDEDTCTELNAMQRDKSKVPDCRQTQDWFLGLMARPAKHTVEHIEEIFRRTLTRLSRLTWRY
jgi:TPR repeat protein